MQSFHLIKQKVSFNSLFFNKNNEINLIMINNSQLANWNQDISYSESETESEFHSQKTRKIKRKKFTSQIFKICSYLKE